MSNRPRETVFRGQPARADLTRFAGNDAMNQAMQARDERDMAAAHQQKTGSLAYIDELQARMENAKDAAAQASEASAPRLPTDSATRKEAPVVTGVLDYFPLAIADVARLSKIGNDKHNPGQALHWSRGKSDDHADCIGRHMLERGTIDTDGVLHDAKVAWRALAQLQLAIEKLRASGVDY